MNMYQITEVSGIFEHAGSKAPDDVLFIAKEMGFKPLLIHLGELKPSLISKIHRRLNYLTDWINVYKKIKPGSIVLIQNPLRIPVLFRNTIINKIKKNKKAKFISLIHDVEELRTSSNDPYFKDEFSVMLENTSVFIVHNEKMKEFFLKKGISEDRIVVLEIFDYLCDNEYAAPVFERSISIAGNLDMNKTVYLKYINKTNVNIHLYGLNYKGEVNDLIEYHGSFPSNEIPNQLNKGFGLIWDGISINSCEGDFGNYLRYNNPHKLSLYMVSGLPVVIWSQAAEADFVRKNNVGICVDSLTELNDAFEKLTLDEYNKMAANVKKIGDKLKSGYYTKKALMTSVKKLS